MNRFNCMAQIVNFSYFFFVLEINYSYLDQMVDAFENYNLTYQTFPLIITRPIWSHYLLFIIYCWIFQIKHSQSDRISNSAANTCSFIFFYFFAKSDSHLVRISFRALYFIYLSLFYYLIQKNKTNMALKLAKPYRRHPFPLDGTWVSLEHYLILILVFLVFCLSGFSPLKETLFETFQSSWGPSFVS